MTSVVDVGWSFSEAEGAHKRVAGKDKEAASTLTQPCVERNLHIVWRYSGAYAQSETHTGTRRNRQTHTHRQSSGAEWACVARPQ